MFSNINSHSLIRATQIDNQLQQMQLYQEQQQ